MRNWGEIGESRIGLLNVVRICEDQKINDLGRGKVFVYVEVHGGGFVVRDVFVSVQGMRMGASMRCFEYTVQPEECRACGNTLYVILARLDGNGRWKEIHMSKKRRLKGVLSYNNELSPLARMDIGSEGEIPNLQKDERNVILFFSCNVCWKLNVFHEIFILWNSNTSRISIQAKWYEHKG